MIKGEFHINGGVASGWARDDARAEPLWLELLADGLSLGTVRADLKYPDGCGFWLEIPIAALEENPNFSMRVANSDVFLPRRKDGTEESDASTIGGEIFVDNALTISGWAVDPLEPEKKLVISLWADDQKVDECLACLRRYSPPPADGHAFILHFPFDYADGRFRKIRVRDELGRELPDSPIYLCPMPSNAVEWYRSLDLAKSASQSLVADFLATVQQRFFGVAPLRELDSWKKAFPVPKPAGKSKIRIWAPYLDEKSLGTILAGQQHMDCRVDAQNYDYALFIQPGEKLHPAALGNLLGAMRERNAAIAYADGENMEGQPLFRQAWDRHFFLGHDYLGPFLAKAEAMRDMDIANCGYAQARLILAMGAGGHGGIIHLPQLLCQEQPITDCRQPLVQDWLDANFPGSHAEPLPGNLCGIHYGLHRKPSASIIIPTRDKAHLLKRCIDSLEQTDWPDLEYIVVDNGSVERDALDLLAQLEKRPGFRILHDDGIFNYARLNNECARIASGELLCLLNNDTEALTPQWLAELAAPLLLENGAAGCTGAKLLWPNGLVQHGGVVVGINQLAGHVGNHWQDSESGYLNRNLLMQQYSAVTAACLLTPKKTFLDMGGFDAQAFAVTFNDVDYCLRLRAMGKEIIWTPHARLVHHESASRGKDETRAARSRAEREMHYLRTRWGHYQDPFHNPNLPLSHVTDPFYGLAFPPRSRAPR